MKGRPKFLKLMIKVEQKDLGTTEVKFDRSKLMIEVCILILHVKIKDPMAKFKAKQLVQCM